MSSIDYYEDDYDDPYISNNLGVLKDIPIILEPAKLGANSDTTKIWLMNKKAGSEIVLDTNVKLDETRTFLIKPLPATAGIPYLIYSQHSNTPMTIGTIKGGTKVPMSQANDEKLTDFAGWDIVPVKNRPGYFKLVNMMYLT